MKEKKDRTELFSQEEMIRDFLESERADGDAVGFAEAPTGRALHRLRMTPALGIPDRDSERFPAALCLPF